MLTNTERLKLAFLLSKDYDGSPVEAIAEAWAEDNLKMIKTTKGDKGIDGYVKTENGKKQNRTLQVKSKKTGAHSDNATYVTLSKSTLELAEDLLVVFVDYDTCEVTRAIGPIPIKSLKPRKDRYYVSDMIMLQPSKTLDHSYNQEQS